MDDPAAAHSISQPPEAGVIVARFRYTVDEYLAANRLQIELRRAFMPRIFQIPVSWKPYLLTFLVVIGIFITIIDNVVRVGNYDFKGLLFVAIAALLLALEKVILPFAWRAIFKRVAFRDADVEWRLAPDLIMSTTAAPYSKSEFDWKMIVRAAVSPGGILLCPSSITFYWLPRNAFVSDTDFQRAIDLVALNVKATKFIK